MRQDPLQVAIRSVSVYDYFLSFILVIFSACNSQQKTPERKVTVKDFVL